MEINHPEPSVADKNGDAAAPLTLLFFLSCRSSTVSVMSRTSVISSGVRAVAAKTAHARELPQTLGRGRSTARNQATSRKR
jgi:hypothetical protein